MSEEVTEKKNKKISKMTIDEIETAIKKSTESMNGSTALYLKHLNQRKQELESKTS